MSSDRQGPETASDESKKLSGANRNKRKRKQWLGQRDKGREAGPPVRDSEGPEPVNPREGRGEVGEGRGSMKDHSL